MVNPIAFSPMIPQQVPISPVGIGGTAQTASSFGIGGSASFPPFPNQFQGGNSRIGGLVNTLERLSGTINQLLQSLKGGFGGISQPGFPGYPGIPQPGYPGYPGISQPIPPQIGFGYPGVQNPLTMANPYAAFGINPAAGQFGVSGGFGAPFNPLATAGSFNPLGMFGGVSGSVPMGPFSGFPGAGGLPVGMPTGFPGSFGGFAGVGTSPFGPTGFPTGIGGSPLGFGATPIGIGGIPGVTGGISGVGIPGQIPGQIPGLTGIPGQIPGQVPGATAPASGGTTPFNVKLSQDDFVDFILAGSQGGRSGTNEVIDSRFARPGSRFSQAGDNEFDGVIAAAYASQFKAYAMGLEAAFSPGKDPNQLAANIARAQSTQFTPEAEILSKVAAVYRGDLTGVNKYNNQALQQSLVRWGRQDLASQPGVGVSDVESIGSVIKALNEQQNPQVRAQWLQEIFDFQNNSPSSPSGAVPNVRQYQDAINIVKSGALEGLVSNYQQGIRTQGPIQIPAGPGVTVPGGVPGGAPGAVPTSPPGSLPGGPPGQPAIQAPNVDFRQLNDQQRTQISNLTDRERAILHLWGRQMIAKGGQDGGILLTVQENLQNGQNGGSVVVRPAEAQLAQELIAKDMQEFGGVTGKNLDREFFNIMATKFNEPELAQRYGNSPVFFAANDPNGAAAKLPEQFPVDSPEWEAAMSRRNGLNSFENGVLRLWGHDTLDGGVDGSVLAFTLMGGNNPLDRGMDKGIADALLKSDAADGRIDGSSIKSSFKNVMDKLYLGPTQPGASVQRTFADAEVRGQTLGLTVQQMAQNMQLGMIQAADIAKDFAQNHPMITAAGAGGLMAATAICPFLGGLAAGGAGVALGQKMLNGQQQPATA